MEVCLNLICLRCKLGDILRVGNLKINPTLDTEHADRTPKCTPNLEMAEEESYCSI